jgi:rhodanese-related sulfurtransferase
MPLPSVVRKILFSLAIVIISPAVVYALDVKLDENRDFVDVIHENGVIKVMRVQDLEHTITGGFAKTSRNCPPFCIQPMSPLPGIKTVGEMEIFNFMEKELVDGTGVLIDARTPSWHSKGTIPGSINIPFTVFAASAEDPELHKALRTLGVRERSQVSGFTRMLEEFGFLNGDLKTDNYDFSQAKTALLWCNGPWCEQSPRAIDGLVKLGYPKDRILYYRGGMQVWQLLGLTTVEPK